MPFTPFHIGPHACLSLPFYRYLDVLVFIGANVAIDIEPLLVMILDLDYPLHGYCHTFILGGGVGVVFATALFPFRGLIRWIMGLIRIPYSPTYRKFLISGLLGAWLHVLFDAPLYYDIKPFFPLQDNPLFGLVSSSTIYRACAVCFVPALLIYLYIVFTNTRKRAQGS